MCFFAIYVTFLHQREIDIKLFLREFVDLGVVPRLLLHELVARESNDFQAKLAVLFVQVPQRLVLLAGELSFRRDVCHNHTFFASDDVAERHGLVS